VYFVYFLLTTVGVKMNLVWIAQLDCCSLTRSNEVKLRSKRNLRILTCFRDLQKCCHKFGKI